MRAPAKAKTQNRCGRSRRLAPSRPPIKARVHNPEERIKDFRALLAEHFDDFVVITRSRDVRAELWAYSDSTWARAAMENLLDRFHGCEGAH